MLKSPTKLFLEPWSKTALIWLLAAILTGAFLRFWQLGTYPPGFTWDEAAITYDAWSISQWGHDHWGQAWPMAFRSLGDYKAPVTIYLLAGLFKVAGLHFWAIRYVTAVFGTLLIAVTYLITLKLGQNKKYPLALTAAWLTALAPWLIHLSRIGYEAGIATTLTALGVYFWLRATTKRPGWSLVGTLFFTMSFFTYQSPKIVIPLLFVIITWYVSRKVNLPRKWYVLSGVLIGLCLTILIGTFATSGQRALTTLVLSGPVAKILLIHLIDHLRWLYVINGQEATLRHMVPGYGLLAIWALPFFIAGWWKLRNNHRELVFLGGWFLAALIPSIIGQPSPHTLRLMGIAPVIQIITALGLVSMADLLNRRVSPKAKLIFIGGIVVVLSYGLSRFWFDYRTTYPQMAAGQFQFGYQQAMAVIKPYLASADHIYVTDAYGPGYIYALLYNRITAREFLAGGLANFTFGPIHWPSVEPNAIFVGTPQEIPVTDIQVFKTIFYPNGEPAFVIARRQ